MDNETLAGIFEDVGADFGFDTVNAEFCAYADVKVRWVRQAKIISFTVTDYLEDAPEEVIEDIARRIMCRIRSDDCPQYSDTTNQYFTSQEFVERNQTTYLERKSFLSEGSKGKHRDIQDSYERLMSAGLVDEINGLALRWTDCELESENGLSSLLMKVVLVPSYLDSMDVSDEIFDYNLYRLLVNIIVDFGINPDDRRRMVDDMIASYPGASEFDQVISERHLMSIRGEC
jgi:hypothetical protein